MIEKLMEMNEKQIYKIYTIAMILVVIFQIIMLLWQTNWLNGIGLGFNAGIWAGFSLRRLVK